MEEELNKASSEYSRQLEAAIKWHTCECGKDVRVVWVDGEYHLKCNGCGLDPALKRVKSYRELWNSGEFIPGEIAQTFKRQEARRVSKHRS